MSTKPEKTELKLEFLSMAGINPFCATVSSPRMVMDASHTSQRPSLINPQEPVIKTGIEFELGKYINDVRADHDYTVKGVITKYKEGGIEQSPLYTIIVEYEEDGELFIDYIDVGTYRSSHGFFGYTLTPTEDFNNITYNSVIPKDTILAKTASLSDDGSYMYGLNPNVVFMSHPSVAEDGFVISESFAEKAKFTSVTKRVINITKDTIPLNVYGNDEHFKFIPNIGERVREDGLLCAWRPRNDWFSVSDLSNRNLREVDTTFDTSMYVTPGSVVIDVKVIRGNYNRSEFTSKMTVQLDAYAEMFINYNRNIVSIFDNLMAEKKALYGSVDAVRLTPKMTQLVKNAMIMVSSADNGKYKLSYRKLPIDQYRVEVTVLTVIKPDLGYKLTDISASKGVVCRILPDECMPVDELGNRADIITDSMSTISRMNLARAYQLYLSAASRDNTQRLIQHFKAKYGEHFIEQLQQEDVTYFYNYVHGFYALINPDMVEFLESLNQQELYDHLLECLNHQIIIYFPPDNAYNITDVIAAMEETIYKPHMGKVTYTDELGNRVTTREDIRVGQLYFMMLEKIANDYSGVSSAKVNNFAFPVKGANIDKHKYPHSLTPTKTLGETETRIMMSFGGPEVTADLFDINLNPVSHKLLIKNMLESEKAFDLDFEIDRNTVDYGNTKSLAILRHIFTAAGFDYDYSGDGSL